MSHPKLHAHSRPRPELAPGTGRVGLRAHPLLHRSPEIATTYGENYWHDMGLNPLPADIVKRFGGKVMAIMGYEQDQVLVDPVGHPGVNPAKDVSVPINWA